jgi:hypothetical protein
MFTNRNNHFPAAQDSVSRVMHPRKSIVVMPVILPNEIDA